MYFTNSLTPNATYNRLGKAIRAGRDASDVVSVISDADVNWDDDDPTTWDVTYTDGTSAVVDMLPGRP